MWLTLDKDSKVISIHDQLPVTENEVIELEGSWTNDYLVENDVYLRSRSPMSFHIEKRKVQAPPEPNQDDYLLDLDYRLSMTELGL